MIQQFLEKLIPNDFEREVMTNYMAACIQHSEAKFLWAILLCGEQGTGKTSILRAIEKQVKVLEEEKRPVTSLKLHICTTNDNYVATSTRDIKIEDTNRRIFKVSCSSRSDIQDYASEFAKFTLKNEGLSSILEFLKSYPIKPELNPATECLLPPHQKGGVK